MSTVIFQAIRMAKKYGQPVNTCKKPSLEDVIKAVENGMDFLLKKKEVYNEQ